MGGGLTVNARKIASLLAVSVLGVGFFSPQYRAFTLLPAQVDVPAGGDVTLTPGVGWLRHLDLGGVRARDAAHGIRLSAIRDGWLRLTLAGIPLKEVAVRRVPIERVQLSGAAIGVQMRGRGSTVVALERVPTLDGRLYAPGIAAGLRIGDRLLTMNGQKVRDDVTLPRMIDRAGRDGREVLLSVRREGRTQVLRARPVFDRQLSRYRLGIYVRDGLNGIGTLTFSDVRRGRFAALGHRVQLTARSEAPEQGAILSATILGLQRAARGRPGQKLGVIRFDDGEIGRIERNGEVGVGGRLLRPLPGRTLAIATTDQVHVGDATLYTVLSGGAVEGYRIRIERTLRDRRAGSKSLVLRVVDKRLLRESGGIVQGMSGSPIVQDGLLAGAVTHVFVHDPARGYGTYAAWMYEELCVGRSVRHGSSATHPSQIAPSGRAS